jgi:hypothetical protein
MAPEVQDPKKLLKIVNYQKCQKTVLSQMERWAATDTHLDHSSPLKKQWSPLRQVPG